MARVLNIYELVEEYVESKVALALNDYDLRFTLDQQIKRGEKLEREVYVKAAALNTRINRLHDKATKTRRANSRKDSSRKP